MAALISGLQPRLLLTAPCGFPHKTCSFFSFAVLESKPRVSLLSLQTAVPGSQRPGSLPMAKQQSWSNFDQSSNSQWKSVGTRLNLDDPGVHAVLGRVGQGARGLNQGLQLALYPAAASWEEHRRLEKQFNPSPQHRKPVLCLLLLLYFVLLALPLTGTGLKPCTHFVR